MKQIIPVNCSSNGSTYNETVELASTCPRCGITLHPYTLYAYLFEEKDESENKIFLLNLCDHCNECFISRHIYDDDNDIYIHESSAPMCTPNINFSDNIKNLSENFVKIYNESYLAESLGMTSICGMGYRKSLEFLVKDFVVSIQPQDANNVASMSLAKCIEQYISDSRLKTLAKASAWLGNDETHYLKKHKNYGIRDLKAFITAFVTFIDAELAYQDAQALLSPSKSPI